MIGVALLWVIGVWATLAAINIAAIARERPDLLKPKDLLDEEAEGRKGKELSRLLFFGVFVLWIWPLIRLFWLLGWSVWKGVTWGTIFPQPLSPENKRLAQSPKPPEPEEKPAQRTL